MKNDSSIWFSSSTLLLLLLLSWIVLAGNASAHFCAQQDNPLLMASTLGGVHDSQGASNSADVDELARFAVDEHNKKEVNRFSHSLCLNEFVLYSDVSLFCRVSLILVDGVCAVSSRSCSTCVFLWIYVYQVSSRLWILYSLVLLFGAIGFCRSR